MALPNGGITFSEDNFAFSIAHGDFRGVGRQDILAGGSSATYTYSVYLLLNNGNGAFSAPQELINSGIARPYFESFVVSDFNGDGLDDFLIVDRASSNASVELSNGDGTFRAVTTALAEGNLDQHTTAVADFNKDGKLDLVYLYGTNAYVLKGNGDGSFQAAALMLPIPSYQGAVPTLYAVTTGDFDGDGKPDIAVVALVGGTQPPPAIATVAYVFFGNGDGTFSAPALAGEFVEYYNTIHSADLGKSGRSDLILQATGLAEPPLGVVQSLPGRLFGPEKHYLDGSQVADAFIADINMDGYPDLLASSSSFFENMYSTASSNSVTALINLGPGTKSNLLASSTTVSASATTSSAGAPITFTATVTGTPAGESSPTGSVRFADQTGIDETVALTPSDSGSSVATFTTSLIGFGSDTMGATYSGDLTYEPSTGTIPLKVTGLADSISLSITPNPVVAGNAAVLTVEVANPAGSSAATPTGYVVLRDGPKILGLSSYSISNGAFTYNPAVFSNGGQHTISVWYSGDQTHVSGSTTQIETVLAVPTVSFTTPASITTSQALSIAVAVTGGTGNPTPTGSITLTASTTENGSGDTLSSAVLNQGSATITLPARALAAGSYWLKCSYTPDQASSGSYAASSLAGWISVVTPPPTFAIAGTNVTVSPGATSGNTSTITVTPSGGFTGSVALSASITTAPAGATDAPTLSFGATTPVSITGSGSQSAVLTINTITPTRAATAPVRLRAVPWLTLDSSAFACAVLICVSGGRRRFKAVAGISLSIRRACVSCAELRVRRWRRQFWGRYTQPRHNSR